MDAKDGVILYYFQSKDPITSGERDSDRQRQNQRKVLKLPGLEGSVVSAPPLHDLLAFLSQSQEGGRIWTGTGNNS